MKISFNFLKRSQVGGDADLDWFLLVVFFSIGVVFTFLISGFDYYAVKTIHVDTQDLLPSEQEFVRKQALQATLEKYEQRKLKTESVEVRKVIYIDPSL